MQRFEELIAEGTQVTYYGSQERFHGNRFRVLQCTDAQCNSAWSDGIQRYELTDLVFGEPVLKHVRRESLELPGDRYF